MKRLRELDFIRVVSMFAVIMIHVSSGFVLAESRAAVFGMNAAFLLNQLSRFAVPMFVMLSGIVLNMQKYGGCKAFITKRLKSVVIPYILWSLFYFAANRGFSPAAMFSGGFMRELARGLLTGGFASHLYFIVVIVQLYILFPAIRKLLLRYESQTLIVSFALSFYFIMAINLRSYGIKLLPSGIAGYAWLLAPTWLFYFVLGMSANEKRLNAAFEFGKKNLWALAVVFLIFALVFPLTGKIFGSYELSIKPEIIFYTCLVFAMLSGVARLLPEFKAIAALSKVSQTVYFLHVYVLIVLRRVNFFSHGISRMLILFLCVSAISIGIALTASAAQNMFKKAPVKSNVQ